MCIRKILGVVSTPSSASKWAYFQKIYSTLSPNYRNRSTYETLCLEKCETMDTVHNMSCINGLAIMNEGKLNLYPTNAPNTFKLASYECSKLPAI